MKFYQISRWTTHLTNPVWESNSKQYKNTQIQLSCWPASWIELYQLILRVWQIFTLALSTDEEQQEQEESRELSIREYDDDSDIVEYDVAGVDDSCVFLHRGANIIFASFCNNPTGDVRNQ